MKLDKETTFDFAIALMEKFQVVTIHPDILLKSFELSKRYQLSSWDALIIATAMHHECTVIYSQDMQHGLKIENRLTIINPFLSK